MIGEWMRRFLRWCECDVYGSRYDGGADLEDEGWKTATGRVPTDADIEADAEEAEQGYDVDVYVSPRTRGERGPAA